MSARKRGSFMRINGNYGNNGIYNLYNSIYQNNMALYNNKLTKSLFPANKAQDKETLGSSAIGYITNLESASKDLSTTLKGLSGSAFSDRTMTSSNSDVMSVSYTGNKANTLSPMTVKIDQLAAGQQNEGTKMNSAAAYEGSTGTNQFSIETGGKTTQLSINVSAGDSNQKVQQKMADAINNAGIGVKATVETDTKNNTSALKTESVKTGSDTKNGFAIKDDKGGLVAQTGANTVTQKGQDAIYSVNGGASRTSQTNTVDMGNGISATFKKASEDAVTISKGQNLDSAKSAVESMVKSFNDLFSTAAERTGDPKSQRLASSMTNISSVYASSLSNIGIGFDNSGKMTINTQKMDQASENGALEKFFSSGSRNGFASQLGRLADNVSRNPGSFVSNSLFGNNMTGSFGYSSFGNTTPFNAFGSGSVLDYML